MLTSVQTFLLTIISVLIIGVFLWAVYAFFQAIYLFIFSAWDTEKIKKARNSIRYMVLWIFLTLFFLFAFPIIFKRINVPWYEAYTANNVFAHTSFLLRWLFSFWREAVNDYQFNGPASWWGYNPYDQWMWTQPLTQPSSWGGTSWAWGTSSWWWWTLEL